MLPFPDLPLNASPVDETPLQMGTRLLPSRYFLAPLAGYTHLAFRNVVRGLGGMGLATTDLVQATLLLAGHPKSRELIETNAHDTPLSVQIFSGIPEHLINAAKWLEEHGYQGIDINMGCPMAKVNGQGGGARLMCDTSGACSLVGQVVNAVSVPVTVKMRLGWDRDQITAPALAREFEQLGIAAITIHGRTRAQGFNGSVDLQGIRDVVEAVERIPIIGNGDIRSPEDAIRMRQLTGCPAVAIGRGALLDPWIFSKLKDLAESNPQREPTPQAQVQFLRDHFRFMREQHGEFSTRLFRKFAAWYGQQLGIPDDLEDRLRRFESDVEFETIVNEIAERHGQRVAKMPTALVKVPNGPVERW
ncbi:tRNA dihydrouridine synthase [Planctomicrobium sp. SH668]|uniref:tRNA dihydrouridine synthase n=1 Tax=Planctomicrobium sp. SH668 TaxID=3448126 RepID=UPI003F5B0B0A